MALDDRSIRALTLVADGRLGQATQDGRRLVESSREGAFYLVGPRSCTCPDSTYRGTTCKHQIALRLEAVIHAAASENLAAAHAAAF
jgi:uncharacterized Zn finger protein